MKNFSKFASFFTVVLLLLVLVACGTDNGGESIYEGVGNGFKGDVTAQITLEDGVITHIQVDVESDSEGFRETPAEQLPAQIIEHQSIEVDAISGATYTSTGIIEAVTDALVNAGVNLDDFRGAVDIDSETIADFEVDIVIVGAGGAGLAAAIEAAETGASVVILERMPIIGGNTLRATAGMNAAETHLQAENEIEDSVELFFEDTMSGGQQTNDPEMVEVLVNNSAAAVHWINDLGAGLEDVTATGGQSAVRTHRPTDGSPAGPAMIRALEDRLIELDVEIMVNSGVESLLVEDGTIIGVNVENMMTGEEFTVTADAVILATGGFSANPEMVESYREELAGYFTTNHDGANGSAIRMAEYVGAHLIDMEEIQTHPTTDRDTGYLFTEALRGDGAILVNNEGVRFINELDTRDAVANAILAQPDTDAFLITNGEMAENNTTLAGYITNGYGVAGETLEALADAIGVDAEALFATIETYGAMVDAGEDTDFGRENMQQNLSEGPFHAFPVTPSIHHTMGGVRIDTQARVLNENGEAIPGLYAAGEIVGGIHGSNRLGGNALTDIIVFGRIAGITAASELQ